jgi:uncharacterized metal-binding protein
MEEKREEKKVVIYNCFGGFSNTGFTAALATIEALKEVGLDKACIACSVGLPANVKDVFENTDKARKIITVDGCPFECARKVVESAGYKVADSIQLARDIQMKKKSLFKGYGEITDVMQHIDEEDVRKAKELIVQKILEE